MSTRHIQSLSRFLAIFISAGIGAQTSTQNYVQTTRILSPITSTTSISFLSATLKQESINYLDGMGRSVQAVVKNSSPAGNDMVQFSVYDQYGRQPVRYMPYTDPTNDGSFKTAPVTNQASFFSNASRVAHTTYPYAETVFDNSPLNRITETSNPGTDWKLGNGHTQKIDTRCNLANEVMRWTITSGGDCTYSNGDAYAANTIYITKMTDANGNYSYEYTDKSGHTVQTQTFLENRTVGANTVPYYLTTFYVYDDFGNLAFVIPPQAYTAMIAQDVSGSGNYSVNFLSQDLCYQYHYDERQRLIEKKAPGSDWQYIVYNQLNQPVMFQDGNLRALSQWQFTKYDVLGRQILTGIFQVSGHNAFGSRTGAQAQFNSIQAAIGESRTAAVAGVPGTSNSNFSYTDVTPPSHTSLASTVLTVKYYDDYDFNGDGTDDYMFNTTSIPCINFQAGNVQSLNTGIQSCISILNTLLADVNQALSLSKSADLTNSLNSNKTLATQINNNMAALASMSRTLTSNPDPKVMSAITGSLAADLDQSKQLITGINNSIALNTGTDKTLAAALSDAAKQASTENNSISTTQAVVALINVGCTAYNNVVSGNTRGYLTGNMVKVMDASNPVQWLTSVPFYDAKGQVIQTQTNDWMGASDLANAAYDFAGRVVQTQLVHTPSGGSNAISTLNHFAYDKMNRLTEVDQQNNSDDPLVLAATRYNELSQLIEKNLHNNKGNSPFLQSVDYTYNILGWLSNINNADLSNDGVTNDDNNDLWGMNLQYNTTTGLGAATQYNGNVAEKHWKSATDNVKRGYGYSYDRVNRLTSAAYAEYSSSAWSGNVGKFNEGGITYDDNGNMLTLTRSGYQATNTFGSIDNLTYLYSGNRIIAVNDAISTVFANDFNDHGSVLTSGEYTYDYNGNTLTDANKGISTTYNFLNQPLQVLYTNGNKIEYMYDALGTRLRKTVTQVTSPAGVSVKYYSGLFEYTGATLSSASLESFSTPEGRCTPYTASPTQFRYEYQVSDQGGNAVLAFSDLNYDNVAATNEAIQQTHYYPFGMQMYGLSTPVIGVENKYKFATKELQDEFNLQQYDFGARYYDPAIARWSSPDPVADLAADWTPFRYGFNNPMTFSDPSGMMEITWDGVETESASTGTITPAQQLANDINSKCSSCNARVENGVVVQGGGTSNSGGTSSTATGSSAGGTSASSGTGNSNNNTADNHTNVVDVNPESLGGLSNGGEAPNVERETSNIINHVANKELEYNGNTISNSSNIVENNISRAEKIMASTLLLTVSTIELPPAAVPILVVGGITAGAVYLYDKIAGKGNANYPGPLSYTHTHPSQNPINNPMKGFDPKNPPNWSGLTKLLIAGKLAYDIYDEYQENLKNVHFDFNSFFKTTKDKTYVKQPPIIIQKKR